MEERIKFEKEVLFPLAGFNPSDAKNYYKIHREIYYMTKNTLLIMILFLFIHTYIGCNFSADMVEDYNGIHTTLNYVTPSSGTAGQQSRTIHSSNFQIDEKYTIYLKWKISPGEIQTSDPCTFRTVGNSYTLVEYEIEYDHQTGYDVRTLTSFDAKVDFAFNRAADGARTDINLVPDEANGVVGKSPVQVEEIFWKDLTIYCLQQHRQTDPPGSANAIHPAQLIIIKGLKDLDPEMQLITGGSIIGPNGYSAIFWDHCNSENHIVKVVIHELGHQRAPLEHLCDAPDKHDLDNCVMGQKEIAVCTGENLVNQPRFCYKCEATLRTKTW